MNRWGFPIVYSPLKGEPVRVVIPLRGSAQEFKAAYGTSYIIYMTRLGRLRSEQ